MRTGGGYPNDTSEANSFGPSFVYFDKNGQPYLRTTRMVRNGKRTFPQQHWENGAWEKGAPTPKIPYRLPELIGAPLSEPVFICEGEKDAENVAALSFIATSNPGGGIPKSWTNDLNRWFAGRTVFICEDCDKTGRNHANAVAAALKGVAVEIRIVEFRELDEHGDVSEWLEHGGTAEQLLAKAKAGRVPSKGYELVRASDIQPENIDWLWYGHLAANKLELLAGVPGAGKSQIQDVYVACVTTGVSWPDGANGQGRRNVIMLTAEDTLNDTLVPRLIAAGADRDRVWFLKCIRKDDKDRMFLLGEDLAELGRMIAEAGEVGLVTIDPITAYLGKLNSHMATDVRAQLGPLKDFAEQVQVGISAITHPPKNAGPSALDQFLGSQAFIAAARVGHLCVEEFEQDASGNRCPAGRMLYTRAKHNPTEPMASLAFATGGTDHRTGLDVKTSKIVWEGLVDITANEALAATNVRKDRGGAAPFLMDMLSNGPVPKTLIDERAVVHAISESQLKTAKTKMGIVAGKEKGKIHGGWLWCLPQHASALETKE